MRRSRSAPRTVTLAAVGLGVVIFVAAFSAGVKWIRGQQAHPVAPNAHSAQPFPHQATPTEGSPSETRQTPAPERPPAKAATADSGETPPATASALPPPGPAPANGLSFFLEELSAKTGMAMMNIRPQFDQKIKNFEPWLSFMGASVAAADFNRDGWVDFYVTNGATDKQNALFVNRRNGTFEEVAAKAGVADENRAGQGISVGSSWGDYNNDGCPDLFVAKWGKSELFRSNCDGTFVRATDQAGLRMWSYAAQALWVDVNRDGCLDLYVANYFRPEHDLWNLKSTRILADDADRSRNGGPNTLYLSDCNGRFAEVAKQYRVDDTGWSLAVSSADVNQDGWPDIYLANDFGADVLFVNEGGRSFRKVKAFRSIGDDTFKGMNVDLADYDNDGRLDIYVTNITKKGFLLEGNMLWHNEGDLKFKNVAWDVGAARCGWGWGAQFVDMDLDGWADIFALNGFRSTEDRDEAWFEQGTMASTPYTVLEDAANFPPLGNRSISGHEPSCLFLNDTKGQFRDVAAAAGATDEVDGRGVAVADIDNNGTPDLVVANQGGPLLVYRNTNTAGHTWVQLKLEGAAPSTRDAIGATVTVKAGGITQTRALTGGYGFAGQSDQRLHFGLGPAQTVDEVQIRWPSGRVQRLTGLAVNRLHVAVERP